MPNRLIPIDNDDDDDKPEEGWLMTFCDISLLLLTFFILVLSMSTINKQQFKESFNAIRDTFGGDQKHITSQENTDEASQALLLAKTYEEMINAQKETFNSVKTFITQNTLEKNMQATFDDGIITLRLPSEVLFAPGSDKLSPEGIEILKKMRDFFLKNREQSINIKGYTDNSPVAPGSRYENNWEVSALRAVNVLRELLEGGIEATRMTATGLGDLEPLVPNDTPENRAQNRRVEFTLERKIGNVDQKLDTLTPPNPQQ